MEPRHDRRGNPRRGAELIAGRHVSRGRLSRSFVGDCLLAASAQEHGFVLVTENLRAFELIAGVAPFDYAAPWPTS